MLIGCPNFLCNSPSRYIRLSINCLVLKNCLHDNWMGIWLWMANIPVQCLLALSASLFHTCLENWRIIHRRIYEPKQFLTKTIWARVEQRVKWSEDLSYHWDKFNLTLIIGLDLWPFLTTIWRYDNVEKSEFNYSLHL